MRGRIGWHSSPSRSGRSPPRAGGNRDSPRAADRVRCGRRWPLPAIALSDAALALFGLHIERRGDILVDDSNRTAYRELARAGLMVAGNSFAGGQESVYHVTKLGFERKAELLAAPSPSPGSAA